MERALDLSRTTTRPVSDVSDLHLADGGVTADSCHRALSGGLAAVSARRAVDAFMSSLLPPQQQSSDNKSASSSGDDSCSPAAADECTATSLSVQDNICKSFAVDALMGLSSQCPVVTMATTTSTSAFYPYSSLASMYDMSTPLHVAAVAQEQRRRLHSTAAAAAATLSPNGLDLDRHHHFLLTAPDLSAAATCATSASNLLSTSLLFSQGQGQGQGSGRNLSLFSPLFDFEPAGGGTVNGTLTVADEEATAAARAFFAVPTASSPASSHPTSLQGGGGGGEGGRPGSSSSKNRPAGRGERSLEEIDVKRTRLDDVTAADLGQDDSYWERRKKNNEAAKRSRDARRVKEEKIAQRAAFLEQENLKLRAQVALLKTETAKLHFLLYNRI